MDEQKDMYEKNEPGLKDCWVKFALLILALFLGSYLATYFIIDQTRHSYYINPMRENGYMNKYYDEGLRIIEVYKHQFVDLNQIIAQIKDRNYKFIIYMDDLSFEEFEIEYKYLKAVIEGGLEKKPDNVLIYATSNRRNLVRERAADKLEIADEDDLHSSDTVQEKLSLVYRFGVRIYFGKPDKKQFQEIVRTLAARYGVTMPEDELLLKANQWELSHGGLTGRAAQQFIDYIVGTEEEKRK